MNTSNQAMKSGPSSDGMNGEKNDTKTKETAASKTLSNHPLANLYIPPRTNEFGCLKNTWQTRREEQTR
ncbi:hypothetical protein B6A27_00815 [Anoxybacillus sp. UARK-01]|nr:hypothetical protein B6A27_00815 [Anoxybacillus sp. UARK-01]